MKFWLVPVTVAAFLGGLAGGALSRPDPKPAARRIEAAAADLPVDPDPATLVSSGGAASSSAQSTVTTPPAAAPHAPRSLSHNNLLSLAAQFPRRTMTRSLWDAVWKDRSLERKAFECTRRIRNPETLTALLFILDNIQDDGLRSEIISEMHTAEDPVRRRFLAGILGAKYQEDDFLDSALGLIDDEDIEVARAALEGIHLGRFQEESARSEAAAKIKRAAGRDRPAELRARALASMSKAREEADLRFLLDSLAQENDAECRQATIRAMCDFELGYGVDPAVMAEAIRTLWKCAVDPSEPESSRRAAESAVRSASERTSVQPALSETEWAYLLARLP